jgi:branched-chain amino acid transport system ATP-binding protein
VLKVEAIDAYYGTSHVLQGVSLQVGEGEVVGILGRNGVGKTTTLKTILHLVPPRRGRIFFQDREVTHLPAYKMPRLGIGYVPQGRHVFPKLTVLENLKTGLVKARQRRDDEAALAEVLERFPRLRERLRQPAGALSGGEQQMLAIGRALLGRPSLILLDEPTEGLMPAMVALVAETIRQVNRQGVGVLLVEQNVHVARELCARVYIMEKGRVTFEGVAQELRDSVLLKHLGV